MKSNKHLATPLALCLALATPFVMGACSKTEEPATPPAGETMPAETPPPTDPAAPPAADPMTPPATDPAAPPPAEAPPAEAPPAEGSKPAS